MKRIFLLKPGTFTDANGVRVTITAADVAAIAASYDPQLHEAPLVVGHPKLDLPAYGWAERLEVTETGELVAVPHQVDSEFGEMVEAGRFKKISAALYGARSASNPSPGKPYLRHIGFFGAHPPAVKGLKSIEFGEDEEGLILVDAELADAPTWSVRLMSGIMRNIRSYIASKDGEDAAEKVIPNHDLDHTIEALAHREGQQMEREHGTSFSEAPASDTEPTASEPAAPIETPSEMTPEEKAKLEADRKAAEERAAKVAEREAAAEAREKALADREVAAKAADDKRVQEDNHEFAERLAGDGARILPRHTPVVAGLLDRLMGVASADTIELGEGDEAEQVAPADALRQMLSELPQNVEFNEVSKAPAKGEQTLDTTDGIALGEAASRYIDDEAAKGRTVSASAAVAHVKAQQAG